MNVRKNHIGEKYGRLTIIAELPPKRSNSNRFRTCVLCKCECGIEKNFLLENVLRAKDGRCISCGCWGKEFAGDLNKKHGLSRTDEYFIWNSMRERCNNPKTYGYRWYGARGIKVCERWLNSFENFFDDMGARPTKNHSIDRYPDKDGDYEKINCRWATTKEQAENKNKQGFLKQKV